MDEIITRDISGDATSDVTWMTYIELGRARRISAASAKRLAIRRHWRRHQGNDGTARVAVPVTEAVRREPQPRDSTGDDPGDNTGDVTAFATALAAIREAHAGEVNALRERAEVAERRADTECQRADSADGDRRAAIALADQTVTLLTDAVARADRAEQAIAGERAQVDALRERLNAMQVQFVDAHAALQAAEAADARADRAEADRNAERERADALRGQIEAMQAQLAAEESAADQARQRAEEAVQVADALRRAEEARQGRGLLVRLRAAWRGSV